MHGRNGARGMQWNARTMEVFHYHSEIFQVQRWTSVGFSAKNGQPKSGQKVNLISPCVKRAPSRHMTSQRKRSACVHWACTQDQQTMGRMGAGQWVHWHVSGRLNAGDHCSCAVAAVFLVANMSAIEIRLQTLGKPLPVLSSVPC